MIIVRVELHSAVTGQVTEIARAVIINDGTGTAAIGDYQVCTLRGRDREALDRHKVQRAGRVLAYPRQALHVWNLVIEALAVMGYGRKATPRRGDG